MAGAEDELLLLNRSKQWAILAGGETQTWHLPNPFRV